MKACVLAIVVLSTSPAIAHPRHCDEESDVVGYQRCSRFGTGWSGERTLAWELGATMLRMPFDAVDRTVDAGHVIAPAGTAAVSAIRLRNIYNLARHFYIATELSLGKLTGAPELVIEPAARDIMSLDGGTHGTLFDGMLAAGTRASLGPVAVGSELAFGPRVLIYSKADLPGVLFGQGGVALEARVHASVWLSPHWSAGVMLATSVLERDDVSITCGLGLHAFPFDGGR